MTLNAGGTNARCKPLQVNRFVSTKHYMPHPGSKVTIMNLSESFIATKLIARLIPLWLAVTAPIALPLSLAVAQDFEAVEKRLAKGVVKGELSLQQAAAMMEMLHEIA